MPNFQESIGALVIAGTVKGTAWMVTADLALTASHCFDEEQADAEIHVRFGQTTHVAILLDHDPSLDVILLRITANGSLPSALPLLACPATDPFPSAHWKAHGFPGSITAASNGVTIAGTVNQFTTTYNNVPSVLLYCQEGLNVPNFRTAVFGGMSGGPIVSNRDGVYGVFGMIFEAPISAGERLIYGVRLDSIINKFAGYLAAVPVKSWDITAELAVIVKQTDGSIKSNIDNAFIGAAWKHGITGVWCNIRADESASLSSAIARLLLHASGSTPAALQLAGASAWRDTVISTAREWVPVVGFIANNLTHYYVWQELNTPAPPDGRAFTTYDELARELHRLCDHWLLHQLRDNMQSLLVAPSTASMLGYEIADDLRREMRPLWTRWFNLLEKDPDLLHHFLALFLTENGVFDRSISYGAAGPRSLNGCLFRPLVYAVAVCACLPPLADLKHPQPGNLGTEDFPGHACGIEIFKAKKLHLGIGRHSWATIVALVPNCEQSWAALQTEQQRFDHPTETASLRRDPVRSVVFTGDRDILSALELGSAALRHYLEQRVDEFHNQQRDYKMRAGQVD
jgi:Trypsin-like peptidase domain